MTISMSTIKILESARLLQNSSKDKGTPIHWPPALI